MATAVKKTTDTKSIKPASPDNVKKAVAMGKEMSKEKDNSKADVARSMYGTLHEESKEMIIKAFIDGASLTLKGAGYQAIGFQYPHLKPGTKSVKGGSMRPMSMLMLAMMLLVSPLLAAPAPWYKWQSKIDGKVFCAQTSPGDGWRRLSGSYKDLRCQKPVREKSVQRFGSE